MYHHPVGCVLPSSNPSAHGVNIDSTCSMTTAVNCVANLCKLRQIHCVPVKYARLTVTRELSPGAATAARGGECMTVRRRRVIDARWPTVAGVCVCVGGGDLYRSHEWLSTGGLNFKKGASGEEL
eukprot:3654183-Prymnesium_polylepis.1